MVFDQAANPNAAVVNQGTITIRQAGLAALVAPQVVNSGVITATLGHVVLAGAKTATLDLYGDGMLSLDVTNAGDAGAGRTGGNRDGAGDQHRGDPGGRRHGAVDRARGGRAGAEPGGRGRQDPRQQRPAAAPTGTWC